MRSKPKSIAVRALLSAAGVLLLLLLTEGAASAWLSWRAAAKKPAHPQRHHCEHDPLLGWVNVAGLRVEDLFGPGLHLTINSQRFRGPSDYAPEPPAGTFRIVCLGDSFTMGSGVGDEATYPAWIERLAPGTQTVNMGLAGFGVGQCYLWYRRDGAALQTDVLVLSIIGDDFFRMKADGNVTDRAKPEFDLREGEVVVVNEPVPSPLADHDTGRLLQRFWKRSSVYKGLDALGLGRAPAPRAPATEQAFAPVAEAMLADLQRLSAERGQLFVVAYLPTRREVDTGHANLFRAWLRPLLERLGVPAVNLLPDFLALAPDERNTHFLKDGHYSAVGNRLVAESLLRELRPLAPELRR